MRLAWHRGVKLTDSKRERRELVVGPSRNMSGGLPLTTFLDLFRAPSLTETLFKDTRSVLASWTPGWREQAISPVPGCDRSPSDRGDVGAKE